VTEKVVYTAICRENPAALPVFSQCWWLDAVCGDPDDWKVSITTKGEQVTGVWPYVQSERMSISMMRNPRLTPYLGPTVFFPPDIKQANRDSYEYDVITELLDGIPGSDVWRLSVAPGLQQAGLFRRASLKLDVQQTFLCDLRQSEETIFHGFKESLRRNLRAAEKEITISEEPQLLNLLYKFQQATLQRKRVAQPYDESHMQRLMDACLEHGCGTLWVARRDDTVQAIIWNVWDQERSYYFMGAQNPGADNYLSMSALLWHAIREAKARGNTYFDFEGSMDPGVERFFRNFGAERSLYLVLRRDGHWMWKLAGALGLR
jgi:hypothetical protein